VSGTPPVIASRWRDRGPTLAVALPGAAALLFALQFPFTASPGAASAQVLGVTGGLALALGGALRGSRRDPGGMPADLRWGGAALALLFTAWTLASVLSEVLRPSCGDSLGLAPFATLALPVLALQLVLGLWIGRLAARPWRAALWLLAAELAGVLALALEYWREPTLRVTSHLFVVLTTEQLWGSAAPDGAAAYRGATLLFASAAAGFGVALWPAAQGAFARPRRSWLVATGLLATGLVADRAARRVVAPSHAELGQAYALVKGRGPLVLHADPRTVTAADVDLLLAEGTLWLGRIEQRLGLHPRDTIHVWVHASPEAKRRWTGAARADFALPWKGEIHTVNRGVPHPTLGHELVHVVAGQLLGNPFGVPFGPAGPRYGLIEGLAMAVAPELKAEQDLTLLEDAAALTRLGRLAPARALLAGGAFVTEAHERAYVGVGAAVQALAAHANGPATLQALYRTGTVAGALESSEKAEAFFAWYQQALDTLSLPAGALATVGGHFSAPSIVTGSCRGGPSAWTGAAPVGGPSEAARALDALPPRATLDLAWSLQATVLMQGDSARALGAWRRVLGAADSLAIADASLAQGDLLARAGWLDSARLAWTMAPPAARAPAVARAIAARTLLLEGLAATSPAHDVAAAALDYLVRASTGASAGALVPLATTLARADAANAPPAAVRTLAAYLLGRRLWLDGDLDAAAPWLARVHADPPLPAPLATEALVLHAQALARAGRGAEAATRLTEARRTPGLRRAMDLRLADLAARSERGAGAPERPRPVTATSDPRWADRWLAGPGPRDR
jgi:tetratricopeptide (TPR) repeat protein